MEELEEKIRSECRPQEGKVLALSGGVDSSLLAVFLKPEFAITVHLPGGEKYDETEWAEKVCRKLGIQHLIVYCDDAKWEEYMKIAVKAIGRPIPHFNIFPLYCMYQKLHEMGETELILGDGPDEVMCGYTRDLIIHHLYKLYELEAFENYTEMLDKILPPIDVAIEMFTGHRVKNIIEADILMRKDMDDMSDGIAEHFGIKNIRPYQDNKELDDYMRNLPIEQKIQGEYGKWTLRQILAQYLPEIADRKKKVGGPVYPVNVLRGWLDNGEFDKTEYLNYQKQILHEN